MCPSELMPGVCGFSQSAFDPQAGVPGSCALSDVGVGNQTQGKGHKLVGQAYNPGFLGS